MRHRFAVAALLLLVALAAPARAQEPGIEAPASPDADPFEVVTKSCDQIHVLAKELARLANAKPFDRAAISQQRDRLREQVEKAADAQARFLEGLDETQREAVAVQSAKVKQLVKDLRGGLTLLDTELMRYEPDRARLTEEARAMDKAVKDWTKLQRKVSDILGIAA